MKKITRILSLVLILALCAELSACCIRHEYSDATCQSPGVCLRCGKVKDGSNGEHVWKPASCSAPKTCTLCGETQGEPTPHTFGEWEDKNKDDIGGAQTRKCSVCGETESRVPARKKAAPKTVVSEKGLTMDAAKFAQYLITFLPETLYITDVQDGKFAIEGTYPTSAGQSDETAWVVGLETDNAKYKERVVVTGESTDSLLALMPYLYDALAPQLTGDKRKKAESTVTTGLSEGLNGVYLGKADLGVCMCTAFYAPALSDYPMLTFATAKFVNG